MSYMSISKSVADHDLVERVRACVADEGRPVDEIPSALFWHVAIADDIEAAYESALLAGTPSPGADESVISDQMILGNVQAYPWPVQTTTKASARK